ncbi:MAG: zinc-binding dehydrogenase [Anaerolineales bacterium]|nr:zinc-binding dehydrogenase [Anaerolineales bacterium]
MKVLRLDKSGKLNLFEGDVPAAKQDETLIQVSAVGICGSDVHWIEHGGIGDEILTEPLVLGHEFAGVVTEGIRKDHLVAVDPAIPCWKCDFCHLGHPNFCQNLRFAGHRSQDGALREYMPWPTDNLYEIPTSMTPNEGAMLEPLGVAIHATDLGKLKAGMRIGVYGCGPIGLLIVQLARIMGAVQIVATDKLNHRLEAAESFGATQTFLAQNGNEIAGIMSATNSGGVDVAIEAAGENEAVETAIETVKFGGRVVLVGIPQEDRTSFRASAARRKGLTIKLSRRMKLTYPRAINLVKVGLIDVKSIVSHEFPLAEYEQAFRIAQKREGLKVVIRPSK